MLFAIFHPNFIIYGVMKVVIIVIVPTMGSKNELVEPPTSTPPLATTSASSPPEEDRPNADLSEVNRLIFCALDAITTVRNLARYGYDN